VAGAGVYFVYRSPPPGGDLTLIGSTGQTVFKDVDILPEIHYWYAVAAADFLGRPASERLSERVEGWSTHTFAWAGTTLAFDAGQYSLAPDVNEPGSAFIAWTAPDQSDIEVSRYEDGEWSDVADPFGFADGSVSGSLSITTASGVPFVTYRDESAAGKATAARLDALPDGDEWTTAGAKGQSSVPVRDITSVGHGDYLYVVALDDTDPLVADPTLVGLRYSAAGGWESLPSPGASGSNPKLVSGPSFAALAFEDDADPSSTIQFFAFDSAWVPFSDAFPVTPGNIPDGYFDFAVDTTTGAYVCAYLDGVSEAIEVYTYDGVSWTDLSPAVTADPGAGAVGIAADNGVVYLYYRDLDEGAGIVLEYSGGQWSAIPQSEDRTRITGRFNVSALEVESLGNLIFAGAIEGGSLAVDVFE
jgi:hypothetical protein